MTIAASGADRTDALRLRPDEPFASRPTAGASRHGHGQGHRRHGHGLGDGQAIPWEYAPAPESREIVTIRGALRPDHRRQGSRASDGGHTFTTSTRPPRSRWPRSPGRPEADVDTAVRAARQAQSKTWGKLPGRERAKYLFRIARLLQERSREFAVLEIDGLGQADQGVARRRRARSPRPTSGTTRAGPTSSTTPSRAGSPAARRRRPGDPLELPAADARLEDRARPWRPATRSSSSRPARRR